jgi:CDP-diacylglycerol---glycerol-3-phosphate 3-phosphatidyltransferase
MKHLPNILTSLRIALSLLLFFLLGDRMAFLIAYLAGGLTDALDGFLARRLHCQSRLGATLDSVADLFMFSAVIYALFVWMGGVSPLVLALVVAVTIIRVAALIIARVRFGRFAFLHTIGNKITGALLFLYPVEYLLFSTSILLYPLFACALLSAAEECVIHLRVFELDLDRKGLFFKKPIG